MQCKDAEAREEHRIQTNAKRAKEAVDLLFPCEKWEEVEDRIYRSSRRPVGLKTNYADELHDAKILKSFGSTVYLAPELRSDTNKKYDAIVDGLKMEFKNMSGCSARTLADHFLRSREQAPNVFINLEKSPLSHREIMSTLYGVRNGADYQKKIKTIGGKIILKIKEQKKLIYLNADDLKIKNRSRGGR